MPKVFPCYSSSDKELACELGAFLERGAGVEVLLEEGELPPGGDLIAKVQEGLSADAVLVLLSPEAVPGRWILERWKSVFWDQAAEVGTALATMLCRDCKFPDLLRRKNFFDLRGNRLEAFRAAKRWLLGLWPAAQEAPFVPARLPSFGGRDAELESLCTMLADAPGMAAVTNAAPGSGKTALALEFARRYRQDFDAVFWLTCGKRTAAALAGDLAAQLSVRLERDLESNLNELRQLCSRHRCLLVLDDAAASSAALLAPRGRTSVLITTRQDDLAGAISAVPFPLAGQGAPDPVALGDLVRRLDRQEQRLLAAACACAASGFHLDMAARTAGIETGEAMDIVAWFLSRDALIALDQAGRRFLVPSAVREAAAPLAETDSWERRHGVAAADLFDAQIGAAGDLTAYWPDLQLALGRALAAAGGGSGSWELACRLARRGVAWARAQGRIAEAFEILQDWGSAAEQRSDRRVLEDCAWEKIWILEHWGCSSEARILDGIRRREYADQLSFDFLQS
jgi:hypothetical protein